MLFEVTFADGTTQIMRAHTQRQVKEALAFCQPAYTAITRKRRCRACRKAVAQVQELLCATCWEQVVHRVRTACQDIPISDQDIASLALSFFVDG